MVGGGWWTGQTHFMVGPGRGPTKTITIIPVQIFGPHKNPNLSISVLNTNTVMVDNNTVDTNTNLEGKDSRLKANTTWYVQCQPLPLQVC